MYRITDGIIHGPSFGVLLEDIEFLTWRLNEETGEYWMKFHVSSGKEIRIKLSFDSLNDIFGKWAIAKGNDTFPYFNGDENELDKQ